MTDPPNPSMLNGILAAHKSLGVKRSAQAEAQTVVICPSSQMPAAVVMDCEEHMLDCSRRPADAMCSEDCTPQLRYTVDDLQHFLSNNEGRMCAVCWKPIESDDWYASRLSASTRAMNKLSGSSSVMKAHSVDTCYACWEDRTLLDKE